MGTEEQIETLRNTVMEISDLYDNSKKEMELLEIKISKVRKKMEDLKQEKTELERQIHKLRIEKKTQKRMIDNLKSAIMLSFAS